MRSSLVFSAFLLVALLGSCGESSGGVTTSTTEPVIEDVQARYAKGRQDVLDADQYEYTFAFTASLKYKGMSAAVPASFSGVTQWNKSGSQTNYYQKRTAAVKLFGEELDYSTYFYNLGTSYIKVQGDGDADFSLRNVEAISDGYNFEAKSFGKLLRYLEPSALSQIVHKDDKYNLSIKGTTQYQAVNDVLSVIEVSKIASLISRVTKKEFGVAFNANAYVTFSGNDIHDFHFDIAIAKDDFAFTMNYDQTYTHVGSGVDIVVPNFGEGLTNPSAIETELGNLQAAFAATKAAASSQYDYTLKTGVDHGCSSSNPLGLAVNSTSAGTTKRALKNGKVYFDNRLEMDSDYKNKDQYPDVVEDYERYRANVNDGAGTVYDCIDEVFPKANVYTELQNHDNAAIDEYYMLPDAKYFSTDYVGIMKKTALNQEGAYEYKLGLSSSAVQSLLADYNKAIRLDADLAQHIDVYQVASAFTSKKVSYLIDVNKDGLVSSVKLVLKGFYAMTGSDEVKFSLNLDLTYDWTAKAYAIPASKEDISLF